MLLMRFLQTRHTLGWVPTVAAEGEGKYGTSGWKRERRNVSAALKFTWQTSGQRRQGLKKHTWEQVIGAFDFYFFKWQSGQFL